MIIMPRDHPAFPWLPESLDSRYLYPEMIIMSRTIFNRIAAAALCLSVLLGCSVGAAPLASAAPVGHTYAEETESGQSISDGLEPTSHHQNGVKSFLVKKALKAMAKIIRGGSEQFIRMAGSWLDDGARAAIRNNSGRIANAIDQVAGIPDIATYRVRQEIYKQLVTFLDPGTAETIAAAAEGVLWILL